MRRFIKVAGLLIAGQILLVIIVGSLALALSPWADPVFEVLVFVYLPMIKVVEWTGHFVGDANIIEPIIMGVPLGVLIYGIVGAAAVCLIKKQK